MVRRYLKKDLKLGKKKFRHLVVIGHPDRESFCYNGIFKTITKELEDNNETFEVIDVYEDCLLYTSPSPRDGLLSRMPSSA